MEKRRATSGEVGNPTARGGLPSSNAMGGGPVSPFARPMNRATSGRYPVVPFRPGPMFPGFYNVESPGWPDPGLPGRPTRIVSWSGWRRGVAERRRDARPSGGGKSRSSPRIANLRSPVSEETRDPARLIFPAIHRIS